MTAAVCAVLGGIVVIFCAVRWITDCALDAIVARWNRRQVVRTIDFTNGRS